MEDCNTNTMGTYPNNAAPGQYGYQYDYQGAAYPAERQDGKPLVYGYAPTQPVTVEPPLDQPWYGIDFLNAMKRFFQKYATFSGRASRSEYWWSYLGVQLLSFPIAILSAIAVAISPETGMAVFALSYLAILIPSYSVAVRRLHDTNFSGWWLVLSWAIPFLLLVMDSVIYNVFFKYSNSAIETIFETLGILFYVLFLLSGILIFILLLRRSKPEGVRFDKSASTMLPTSAQQQYYGQQSFGQSMQAPTHQQPSEAQPPYSPMQ